MRWWTKYDISPVCSIKLAWLAKQTYRFEIALSEKVKNHFGDTLALQAPLSRRLNLANFFKEILCYLEPKSPILQTDSHNQLVLSQAVDSVVKKAGVF